MSNPRRSSVSGRATAFNVFEMTHCLKGIFLGGENACVRMVVDYFKGSVESFLFEQKEAGLRPFAVDMG